MQSDPIRELKWLEPRAMSGRRLETRTGRLARSISLKAASAPLGRLRPPTRSSLHRLFTLAQEHQFQDGSRHSGVHCRRRGGRQVECHQLAHQASPGALEPPIQANARHSAGRLSLSCIRGAWGRWRGARRNPQANDRRVQDNTPRSDHPASGHPRARRHDPHHRHIPYVVTRVAVAQSVLSRTFHQLGRRTAPTSRTRSGRPMSSASSVRAAGPTGELPRADLTSRQTPLTTQTPLTACRPIGCPPFARSAST